MRPSQKKQADVLEKVLQRLSLIQGNQRTEDFLSKQFGDVKNGVSLILSAFDAHSGNNTPLTNETSFVHGLLLLGLSDIFFVIKSESHDEKIKAHAGKAVEMINSKIVSLFSPIVLSFFKWDLNRRVWKHGKDHFKLKYLQQVTGELEQELSGSSSDLITKYVPVIFDYLVHQIDTYLLTKTPTEYEKDFDAVYQIRNILQSSSEKNVDFMDEESEADLLAIYKEAARNYIEGIMKTNSRFEFLMYAFVEAQNDYLKILKSVIEHSSNSQCNDILAAIVDGDIEVFISRMNSLFASVPHQLIKNTNEAYYHIFIHLTLQLIGAKIQSEVSTSTGRIDAVLETTQNIYLIEFKLKDSKAAINQIHDRRYYDAYTSSGKQLKLLGLAFDPIKRNIASSYILQDFLD